MSGERQEINLATPYQIDSNFILNIVQNSADEMDIVTKLKATGHFENLLVRVQDHYIDISGQKQPSNFDGGFCPNKKNFFSLHFIIHKKNLTKRLDQLSF